MMERKKKVGVVLFQLGGPDSLDAVEPFLYNLFSDPEIIDFPGARLARPMLARLMASSRARKVQQGYAKLGGKSPLVEWTLRQRRALELALRETPDAGVDARVVVAMRYWHPFTEEAIAELVKAQVSELVLLPLYPQYSKTTTGSSVNEWRRHFPSSPLSTLPSRLIESYHDHPAYIDSLVGLVNETLARFPDPRAVHLVFSAHGVPTAVIEAGDPYQKQVEDTSRLVWERGRWGLPHTVCYQSRVGSGRWLQPSIHEIITRLGAQGCRQVLVIPVSFVSDHIETLHEIDVEVREEAGRAGIEQFEMMPGLNDTAPFIRALTELVLVPAAAPVAR
ncbi:MAG: ferrochelatase [Acidobacteria bacterium]|nr:ferrochelatase [Acidobacteriota bacterium]